MANKGLFSKLRQGLSNLFKSRKLDESLFEELEEQLLLADLGMVTTDQIINNLRQIAQKQKITEAEKLIELLQNELQNLLEPYVKPLEITEHKPFVILMVGVNGVGKTTTAGKLAQKFQKQGKSVLLAAGDTFRAAAIEQLQIWGERNNIAVVAQEPNADPASVIFDAYHKAKAKKIDIVIADTAGRLQNKTHLMTELQKIVRVLQKIDENLPNEIMLVVDATNGQNAISQAQIFHQAVNLSGITITKLDGSAKGGVIFAIAKEIKVPIRFIGLGEGIDDLQTFEAKPFVEAIFKRD